MESCWTSCDTMKTKPQFRGSIILLHDGGGDRSATIAALPCSSTRFALTATRSFPSRR